jgi:hypothetical protein
MLIEYPTTLVYLLVRNYSIENSPIVLLFDRFSVDKPPADELKGGKIIQTGKSVVLVN